MARKAALAMKGTCACSHSRVRQRHISESWVPTQTEETAPPALRALLSRISKVRGRLAPSVPASGTHSGWLKPFHTGSPCELNSKRPSPYTAT